MGLFLIMPFKSKDVQKAYQCEYRKRHRDYFANYRNLHREEKRLYQSLYYYNWYKQNGRTRSTNYSDVIVKWRATHPEAVKAYRALNEAVKRGKVKKPIQCSSCFNTKRLSGHHEDYSKPLSVSLALFFLS